jgi:ABC-type polysaccharide/polyol phosphate transport system ATPase subunit
MTIQIELQNVSKRYRVGRWLPTLRSRISRSENHDYHWAVRDVSFQLLSGEALGIIGPNGAGKTTILKILSQVTKSTSGKIIVSGRLSALIELGAGFHPDLTGRENIFLNGAILGMKREEIKSRFDRIVEFAGIGQYLDTPVKRYSSGMYARLGFSIAAHIEPDVLLVDEVLAVGDFAFQQKCHAFMESLRSKGTTIIFISHNMDVVRRVCTKGLVMYRGKNIFQGSAAEAIVSYSEALRQAARETQIDVPDDGGLDSRVMTFDAEIEKVHLFNSHGKPVNLLRSGGSYTIGVDVCFHKDVNRPVFSMTIRTTDGRVVYDTTTRWMKIATPNFKAGTRSRVEFEIQVPLLAGEYELGVDVAESDFRHYYDKLELAMVFFVESSEASKGMVDLNAKISFLRLDNSSGNYEQSKS